MTITVAFNGSEDVAGTEWSLTTDTGGPDTETSDGVFQIFLTLIDVFIGDELQILVYEKVGSGSTQRIVYQHLIDTDSTGAQTHWVSPALILMNGWDVTCKTISGGPITVNWSIRKVA